jgi:hypothetical protein
VDDFAWIKQRYGIFGDVKTKGGTTNDYLRIKLDYAVKR